MSSNKAKKFICLACLELGPPRVRSFRCSSCGFVTEREAYQRVLSYAERAAHFGFSYRRRIELDVASGQSNVRHAIILDDVLVFAAVAAISGIIGNASYDLLKFAVAKFLRDHSRKSKQPQIDAELFVTYVREFHLNGLNDLPPEVGDVVFEEMLADEVVLALKRGSMESLAGDPAAVLEANRVALRRIASIRPPLAADVAPFASKLPKPSKKKPKPRAKKRRPRRT